MVRSVVPSAKQVLVVDDDARNIFALTSLLENQEMDVLSATNGRSAIDIIQNRPELSIVLTDIMMPDMDGYATMREIRKVPEFRTIPMSLMRVCFFRRTRARNKGVTP